MPQCRCGNQGTLLIEGIGGIMVPLDSKHTVLDWMLALQIPLVLVTGTYLGSLSHTLTCLDVLGRRGLVVKSIIVNDTPGSAVTMQNASDTLANFAGPIPIVGAAAASSRPHRRRRFREYREAAGRASPAGTSR